MITDEYSYINGNYYVTLNNLSGTKTYRALRRGEELISKFPDSIDLKITNKCSIGCPFCHESSISEGKSFDLQKTIDVLSQLPKVGIELAIGGGDVTEDSVIDDCAVLCKWADDNGFVPRLTINSRSLNTEEKRKKFHDKLDMVKVFGVSIDRFDKKLINTLEDEYTTYFKTKVYHIIAGIFPPEDLQELITSGRQVLILGYKNWGRALGNPPKYDLKEWEKTLKRILYTRQNNLSATIGFDNLAIEQLGVRDCITEADWKRMYMGDEFTHTMYVDAVSEIFAPTSRDSFRVSWNDMKILGFFNTYKNDKVNNKE